MWAQEYNENHIDNSVDYCEMCGAEIVDGVPDNRNASQASEALSAIAHLYVEDPIATGVLLRKVVNPHASYSEIAKQENCSKQYICKKISDISKRFPDMVAVLGLRSKASIAQKRINRTGLSSKYKGVTWRADRKKWQVQVVVKSKPIFCGRYDDEITAARKYNEEAIRLLGPSAQVNKVD